MRVQIISDIHLDNNNKRLIQICLDNLIKSKRENGFEYLALMGDIGSPTDKSYSFFLRKLSQEYEGIFLVAGNHEYFQKKSPPLIMLDIDRRLEEISINNFYFLNKDGLIIRNNKIQGYLKDKEIFEEDKIILGSTLWSYIPPKHYKESSRYVGDYRYIYTPGKKEGRRIVTPSDISDIHKDHVSWLNNMIDRYSDNEITILTHHAPTKKNSSSPKYENSNTNCCFATDLEYLMKPNVKNWIYGHTHWRSKQRINDTLVISNPFGYSKELERQGQKISYNTYVNI